jgi:hypothetical protein
MRETISCRKARREMQNALDRGLPLSPPESDDLSNFLPAQVRMHLQVCPGCREFLHSLVTFTPLLRSQLESSLQDWPDPDLEAILRGTSACGLQERPPGRHREAAISAVFQKLRTRLSGAAGRPAALYRWGAAAAVVVLLASFFGLRTYSARRTQRVIEQQIDRVVASLYQEPLLPGIESALLRTHPDISAYFDDLSSGVDSWLEGPDPASYLN